MWRLCFVIVATHHTRAHGMSKRNFISSQSLESDSGMAGSPSALPVTASARRSPRHTPSITKRPSNIAAPNGSPPALPASQYNAQSSFTLLTQVMSSAPPTPTVLPSPVVPVVPPPPRAALPPPPPAVRGGAPSSPRAQRTSNAFASPNTVDASLRLFQREVRKQPTGQRPPRGDAVGEGASVVVVRLPSGRAKRGEPGYIPPALRGLAFGRLMNPSRGGGTLPPVLG